MGAKALTSAKALAKTASVSLYQRRALWHLWTAVDYIRFHCPSCNHLLVVPPEASGLSGPCPNCHKLIQGPNHYSPPQPQPLNPPLAEEQDFTLPIRTFEEPQRTDPIIAPVVVAPTPAPAPEPCPVPRPQPAHEPTPAVHPVESPAPEPFFDEPAPTAPREKTQPLERAKASLSLLQAFLLCFFCSLIFFVLGFFVGKTGAVSWSEIVAAAEKQRETTTEPSPVSLPLDAKVDPLAEPPPSGEADPQAERDNSTARATLEAFLAAETWTVRNAFVMFPDQMLTAMEASAQVHGDGPYELESIRLEIDKPDMKVFEVKAPQHPGTFKVILIKNGGHWLVDWEGFADFYHGRLRAFASGMEGAMKGIFRVLLKPAPGETSPLSPAHCLICTELYPEYYQVSSATDSPARKRLGETFQNYLQSSRQDFEDAMADRGIPLIVELSRSGASNPTLRLDKIVATGWAPLPPQKTSRGDSSGFY